MRRRRPFVQCVAAGAVAATLALAATTAGAGSAVGAGATGSGLGAAVATADLTVDTSTRYQTVDGFGAATPIWGGAWTTRETKTLVGLGPRQLGLSIVRTGLSPEPNDWGTAVASLKAAKRFGSGVKILASPWTAPASFKTNNSRINGGSLKPEYYDDYADHLEKYVQFMKGNGVKIDVTSVQNEPDWHPAYDSMEWTGDQLADFARDQGATIKDTALMVGESVGFSRKYTDPSLLDAGARANITYVGGHLYGAEPSGNLSPYPLAAQYGKNQWMTEYNFHEADGNGSNIWGDPHNKAVWDETLDTVMRTVHRSMEANWSAYVWWYGRRFYSFIGDGEAAYGTTAGKPLKRGYAFAQFAKYVRPGYQRVGLTKSDRVSGLEATAYTGGGKTTVVILNRSTEAVRGLTVRLPRKASAAQVVTTSQASNAVTRQATVNGNRVTVSLPARSISTIIATP